MSKTKMLLALPVLLATLIIGVATASALSGTNADEIKVKVYTEQGDDWFRAIYTKTDDDGVLELKNVLPGKYEVKVRTSDAKSGQVLAAKFKMLDENGVAINEKTDVDVYMYINSVKTLLGTWQTDKNGWLELAALQLDTKYYLDVKDEMHLGSKNNKYRVKVSTKIDGSDWFRSLYKRTDTNKVLKIKNVLPGKYKFKYKAKDATPNKPFILNLRMLDNDADDIDNATTIELYAYVGGQKALIGTLRTDGKGWVTVPGVMTGMKYKIKVK